VVLNTPPSKFFAFLQHHKTNTGTETRTPSSPFVLDSPSLAPLSIRQFHQSISKEKATGVGIEDCDLSKGPSAFAQKAQRPKRSALAFDKASKPSIIIVGRAGRDSWLYRNSISLSKIEG
jgi:hypothetical protein